MSVSQLLGVSWRNVPEPVHQAIETLARGLEESKRENAELRLRLLAMEKKTEILEAHLAQVDAGIKSRLSEPDARLHPAENLREVLERVQHAALASARAAEDEAELARRVEGLDRSRAQITTKLAGIEKARRAREAKLSDAAALLRRLAAG
jgi:hypothetical protein